MAKGQICEVAIARLFKRVYVCQRCKRIFWADPAKVREGKVKCPRCGYRGIRPKREVPMGISK